LLIFNGMPNEPKRCWGCGRLIVFRTIGQGIEQRSVSVDYEKLLAGEFEVHLDRKYANLPQKFLPAMDDCTSQVECSYGCGKKVYQVPVRGDGGIAFFDRLIWGVNGWMLHPHGELPVWNYLVEALRDGCIKLDLPKPRRLASIICLKRIPGPDAKSDQQYSIALKTVSGGKFCSRFVLHGHASEVEITHGDLSALCGRKANRRLLINSRNSHRILDWVCDDDPGGLGLHYNWKQ
jgi:hypothetical protein